MTKKSIRVPRRAPPCEPACDPAVSPASSACASVRSVLHPSASRKVFRVASTPGNLGASPENSPPRQRSRGVTTHRPLCRPDSVLVFVRNDEDEKKKEGDNMTEDEEKGEEAAGPSSTLRSVSSE
eukprot:Hpha_TRINITY_DN7932_c1_g1::TRINITY_DN7932_c1_g1_i1::g.146141::m.146141